MKRLTTAYERVWADGSVEMQYVTKASDLEIENKLGKYEDADVLTWMNKSENSAVITVMVIRKILQECIKMGFVIYDPEEKTWRGVDYHGD